MRITLHIGIEKTGTSSIQRALHANRKRLAAEGVLYPKLDAPNGRELAVAAMDDTRTDPLKTDELARARCSHDEYRRRLTDRLRSAVAGGGYDRLVLSSEHCHSRLSTDDAVRRLAGMLTGIGDVDGVEVIVYLRRQDRLAVSLHTTRLMIGGVGPVFPEGPHAVENPYYRFDRLLARYGHAFGRENLIVRVFEPAALESQDVVADFFAIAGLGDPGATPNENLSLSESQALFLMRFNRLFPSAQEGRRIPEREPILSIIEGVCPGPPYRPPRSQAQAFYQRFEESNASVRAEFGSSSGRPALFDEDFSDYPDTSEPRDLSADELFEFIAAIWRHRPTAGEPLIRPARGGIVARMMRLSRS